MAIDLATATTNNVSETIFDNPISNHRTVPAASIKTSHGKTMKLDSVQVAVTNGGGVSQTPVVSALGTGHLAISHHKGFIEQIRRSITFGSVTNLQPLTKLWLFRRQSSRRQSSTKTSKGNLSSLPAAAKLDSNGNGVSTVNGHHKPKPVVNGAAVNGHTNGHLASNGTNGTADKRAQHTDEIDCDSSSIIATCEIDEIVLDKQSTSSIAAKHNNATVGVHKQCWLDSSVVNNDNATDKEQRARLQRDQDNEPDREAIEMAMVTSGHYGDYTSTATVVFNGQLSKEIDNVEPNETRLDVEPYPRDKCLAETRELQAMTSSNESTAFCVSLEEVDRVPLPAANSIDSGNGSIVIAADITPPPVTVAVQLTDEQILESLRQVVRISTKTDLSKRASIREVFDLLDIQMRSLKQRTKPMTSKAPKARHKNQRQQTVSESPT